MENFTVLFVARLIPISISISMEEIYSCSLNPADDLHGLIAAAGADQSTPHEGEDEEELKARIASHPRYPTLLQAYIDCQKVNLTFIFKKKKKLHFFLSIDILK